MTSYVSTSINGAIRMFTNQKVDNIDNLWTWFRSENTQEWLGPWPTTGNSTINERYTRWFVDTSDGVTPSDFPNQHRNGFYHWVITPAFGPTDKPSIGITNSGQGLIKLIFQPGGDTNIEPYVSNNEQREADTYYRPNY